MNNSFNLGGLVLTFIQRVPPGFDVIYLFFVHLQAVQNFKHQLPVSDTTHDTAIHRRDLSTKIMRTSTKVDLIICCFFLGFNATTIQQLCVPEVQEVQ